MLKKDYLFCIMIICLSLVIAPGNVFAEENPQEKDWQFNLVPLYGWGVNIRGDATVGSDTVAPTVDLTEAFDTLEGAFSLLFSGKYKNKFGFVFDYLYLDVSGGQDIALNSNVGIDLKTQLAELAGTYSFDLGNERHVFDALLGLRYLRAEVDVDLDIAGKREFSQSETKDLLDPIIGANYIWKITDKWNLKLHGDIGGFGIGSDFSWQAAGIIDFWPWKHVGFSGGYRALGYKFEDSDSQKTFELDLLIHGPIIGLSFRW
jgi:hypothetical protein